MKIKTKNTYIQKPLFYQGFTYLAVLKAYDLKQHTVKSTKRIFPRIRLSSYRAKHFLLYIFKVFRQICHYLPNYKLKRQSLMRQRPSAV